MHTLSTGPPHCQTKGPAVRSASGLACGADGHRRPGQIGEGVSRPLIAAWMAWLRGWMQTDGVVGVTCGRVGVGRRRGGPGNPSPSSPAPAPTVRHAGDDDRSAPACHQEWGLRGGATAAAAKKDETILIGTSRKKSTRSLCASWNVCFRSSVSASKQPPPFSSFFRATKAVARPPSVKPGPPPRTTVAARAPHTCCPVAHHHATHKHKPVAPVASPTHLEERRCPPNPPTP